jgi:hypothetical protein
MEKDDFEETILHLKAVIKRDGIESKSGGSAARKIAKIKAIQKMKTEAKRIKEGLKKGYENIAGKTK